MVIEEFTISYPKNKSQWSKRFGLNSYYAGKCWQIRKKDADYWHNLVYFTLREQKIKKKIIEQPVVLRFYFNDRLDCSNHSVYVKFIEDAIKGYLIEDDSRKFVKGIEMYFHDEDTIKVQLIV